MTSVCVLSSGSKGNAIYISDGRSSILVDAGLSAVEIERRLRSRALDPKYLDAIVVSHEHADHIQGVGPLSRRYQLPVHINELTLAASGAQLGAVYETIKFHPGKAFCIGDLCLHPFSVSHDASDSVGFTVQDDATKIGIVTDLGIATQLVCHHLKGCSLIVLEANHDLQMLEEGPYPWHVKQRIQSRRGHLSNEASRDLLGEVSHSSLRHVILAHISETNNDPDRALSVVGEAVSHHRTQLSVAWQHVAGEIIRLGDD
ncbi:MAG: MBL fold metallo-hydrolase [Desulfobacterales bacterium]|nr:MAG: MBL fold metallo-hydrolase [Desulfobacterales bacterium]